MGDDIAVLDQDLGAQFLERLEMQIDRPRADRATTGQGDARFAAARDQRTQHQHRGAHLAHQIVGCRGVGDTRGLEFEHAADMAAARCVPVQRHGNAELGQEMGHGGDVGEMGQVRQHQRFVGEQAGGHQRERRVLGATDGNRALERDAARDANTIHGRFLQPGQGDALLFHVFAGAVGV